MKNVSTLKLSKTHQITVIAMLAAVSIAIYPIEFPLAFLFPDFLKIDFTDLPAIIGTVFFGPFVGICIEFIKNLLHFITQTRTFGIGELANFIVGAAYIVPLGIVFRKLKDDKGYIIGAIAGALSMMFFACLFNYFVLIPFYLQTQGLPADVYVAAAQKVMGFVDSYPKFIIFSIGGFNFVKALMISFLGYFVCVPLKKYLIH